MQMNRRLASALLVPFLCLACGYSQEEWDQKVRENESLRTDLANERQAHKKCEADYSAANQEIDNLKKQLTERGISLDSLNQSLAEQRKALEDSEQALQKYREKTGAVALEDLRDGGVEH